MVNVLFAADSSASVCGGNIARVKKKEKKNGEPSHRTTPHGITSPSTRLGGPMQCYCSWRPCYTIRIIVEVVGQAGLVAEFTVFLA